MIVIPEGQLFISFLFKCYGILYLQNCTKQSVVYRDEIYSLQNLLCRTQAEPGRTVKKEQEEISPNHVQRVNLISVYVTTEHWRGVHHVSDNLWKTEHETDVVILVWPNAKRQVISHPLLMILLKIPAGNSPIAPRLGRKGL